MTDGPPSRSRPDESPDPPYVVRPTADGRGLGVFATRSIPARALVLSFRGPRRALQEVEDFSHSIQVGAGLFLGPSGGADDLVNHSCEPNCGVREDGPGELRLVALEEVACGEELSFDYSTTMREEGWSMPCRCGAPACRGTVAAFPTLPAPVKERYRRLGAVPSFIDRESGPA